ncbi:GumC family protein [Thermithiobacillus plumbiphilus]|uniref:non-specific protein-tyrosine kinase n=1 Tax=Thermithiobacillus plumbiphilus TaxID=1729899 RepID=A0ABU9D9K9_9PROT
METMLGPVIQTPMKAQKNDEIDLHELGLVVRRHWKWIVGITLLCILASIFMLLWSRPVFRSNGGLYLGDIHDRNLASQDNFSRALDQGSMSGGIESQMAVLKSRDLVVQAIKETGLNAQVEAAGSSDNLRNWHWKLSGKDIRLYKPRQDALVAIYADLHNPMLAGSPLSVRFASKGHYQVFAGKTLLGSGMMGQPFTVPNQLSMNLQGYDKGFVPAPGSTYKLSIQPAYSYYQTLIRNDALQVYTPKKENGEGSTSKANVIYVGFKSTQPYQASAFVNQLMADYLAQSLRWKTEEASAKGDFAKQQLEKVRQSLVLADQKLAAYKQKTGIIEAPENAKVMISSAADYQKQATEARMKLNALNNIERQIAAGHIDSYQLNMADSRVLDELSGSLAKSEATLAQLRETQTDASPLVAEQKAVSQRLQQSIAALIANERQMASQTLADLQDRIGRTDAAMKQLPRSEMEIIALTRNAEVLGKLYVFLMQKQEESALSKASTVSQNHILEEAIIPDQTISPKASFLLGTGVFAGLFLSITSIFAYHFLSRRVQTSHQARRMLNGAPTYAALPHLPGKQSGNNPLFLVEAPQSTGAESLRVLRSNIYHTLQGRLGQIIMITSAVPGDGKTTLATNLSHALALDGKKVLLLDLDLRTSARDRSKFPRSHVGAGELLCGITQWRNAVQRVMNGSFSYISPILETDMSPAEILSHEKVDRIFDEIRREFDYIVLDTPAFPTVSDSIILAPRADLMLSVLRIGHTPRQEWAEHQEGLTGLVLLRGVVINCGEIMKTHMYGLNTRRDGSRSATRLLQRAG